MGRLSLDSALSNAVCLIEWAERLQVGYNTLGLKYIYYKIHLPINAEWSKTHAAAMIIC